MPFAGRKHHGDCRFGGTIANRTCLCRGAACRSRHNAADTNRLPLKWYAPIASVRFFGSRYGTAVPSRDCTPRALPRASRSGRHVGLRPPRNDKFGGITRSAMPPNNLQLPKALTDRRYRRNRFVRFYRQPVSCAGSAPGPAVRSPTFPFAVSKNSPGEGFHSSRNVI